MEITGTIVTGIYAGLRKLYGRETAFVMACEIKDMVPGEFRTIIVPGHPSVKCYATGLDFGKGYKVEFE